MILSGVVSMVFGALLIAQSGAGAIAIVWLVGAYALLFGILTLCYLPGRSRRRSSAAVLRTMLRSSSSGTACACAHMAAKASVLRLDRVIARVSSIARRSAGPTGVPICSRNAAAAARNCAA